MVYIIGEDTETKTKLMEALGQLAKKTAKMVPVVPKSTKPFKGLQDKTWTNRKKRRAEAKQARKKNRRKK